MITSMNSTAESSCVDVQAMATEVQCAAGFLFYATKIIFFSSFLNRGDITELKKNLFHYN